MGFSKIIYLHAHTHMLMHIFMWAIFYSHPFSISWLQGSQGANVLLSNASQPSAVTKEQISLVLKVSR